MPSHGIRGRFDPSIASKDGFYFGGISIPSMKLGLCGVPNCMNSGSGTYCIREAKGREREWPDPPPPPPPPPAIMSSNSGWRGGVRYRNTPYMQYYTRIMLKRRNYSCGNQRGLSGIRQSHCCSFQGEKSKV